MRSNAPRYASRRCGTGLSRTHRRDETTSRRQLEKLARHPEPGDELGHRMGLNLTGYRALHFARNRYRIVYRWIPAQDKVEVWGIGRREAGAVYRMVAHRIGPDEK